jgi:hypothetical protein
MVSGRASGTGGTPVPPDTINRIVSPLQARRVDGARALAGAEPRAGLLLPARPIFQGEVELGDRRRRVLGGEPSLKRGPISLPCGASVVGRPDRCKPGGVP